MKITCHSCGAKYTVSDEKVQGKTVKMKCRKCGATIVVGGSAQGEGAALDDSALSHAADGATPEGPPPGSYLVSVTESDQRTMTLAEVVEAYNGGVITAETYVFADGMADWQSLQDNEAIVAALNEAALVSAAVTGTNGSAGYGAQPAPSAGGGYGAPQVYQQPESARPTAARRDAGRKSQDLFGGGGGFGADSGAGMSQSSMATQSSPGKRDENSVLFSLNALTAATAPAARSSANSATKEDSGLIDLKALSANAAPSGPAAAASAPMVDAIGMFPLGAPVMAPAPMPHAGYAVPTAPPSGGSKLGLIIGGVIAVCAVAIVFLLVLRGDDKKTEPSTSKKDDTSTTATASATPSAVATATASTTTSAMASTDESADSASASAVVAVPGKGWKGVPKGTGKTTAGTPTSPTTGGPKTPAKGACGCAPSDLNCALKCSVGKK